MWQFLAKEFKWFLLALVASAPLAIVFWLLHRLVLNADGKPAPLSIRLFLIGWVVMFFCLYVGRAIRRFTRDQFLDEASQHQS